MLVRMDDVTLDELVELWHEARSGVRKLQALTALRDAVERELLVEVSAMVAEGDTWPKVARGLGVTRQGAIKKYAGVLLEERPAELLVRVPAPASAVAAETAQPEALILEEVVLRTKRGRPIISAQVERRRRVARGPQAAAVGVN